MRKGIALLALLGMSVQAGAQWLDLRTPGIPRNADGSVDTEAPVPRTADGRADISGLWVPTAVSGSLLEPENIQAWARDAMAASTANFHSEDPRFHCLPSGPGSYPAGAAYGGQRRIVQSPDFIAVLNSDLTYRQIFVDGRELEDDPFPTWMGYSAAHWEGDTLVVQSNGHNDRTWLHRDGLPHTEALRIVERYRLVDDDTLVIDASGGIMDSTITASAGDAELTAADAIERNTLAATGTLTIDGGKKIQQQLLQFVCLFAVQGYQVM